jgi:hypothetical protein
MLARIIFTVILATGIFKPRLFLKVTEMWKMGRFEMSQSRIKATQIMSAVAIVLIWISFIYS